MSTFSYDKRVRFPKRTNQRFLTHFGFMLERIIAVVANTMKVSGSLSDECAEVCFAFFGSAEALESVAK